ncbi:hypothetical protein JTE90_002718 [Oedothorax gibbosus]|uniref:DDB1-and CUL4-associated factor 8 n=1 Tax=Oedothorax gibbosus TaxID=931172 RepID=A0AAV6VXY6_9ARAC|nr:hypothetical protein JTE90_002718 [Oedothorax gibbosus]
MASTSGSSKSKRSKKNETSEWGESNIPDDSKSIPEVLTPGKRLKTEESAGSENTNENNHKGETSNTKTNSEADKTAEGSSTSDSVPPQDGATSYVPTTLEDFNIDPSNPAPNFGMEAPRDRSELMHSEREDSDADPSVDQITPAMIKKYDPTPKTERPKHKWSMMDHFIGRQYGTSTKYPVDASRVNCYGSLHAVQRLELMYKMKKHDGCVNTVNFNASGSRLVSGSDDLSVIIWDWALGEHVLEYRSGHNTNVFQAKFMPMCDDSNIVTCARDGQVRLGQLNPDGSCKGTRKLAQHKGSVHKLAIQTDSPNCILTCGEDTAVFSIDLREERPSKILSCKHGGKKVPLYSIFSNPLKSHEFVVAGRCQFVKIYDRRFLSESEAHIRQFCPEPLAKDNKYNVTCAVYNYNGEEVLASYNDEDIYLFSSKETSPSKYLHRYRGHRNSQTVKAVNYFGARSEYIVSGSDCGNIFFWDKESEHIVKYMYGDEGGAVNCLEPHPNVPILATSGLDDDIKIWVPSCEHPPDMSNLQKHIIQNMKCREEDSSEMPDAFVDQTIWFLMQHLSRARRRDEAGTSASDSSSTLSDDEYDVDISPSRCNQS